MSKSHVGRRRFIRDATIWVVVIAGGLLTRSATKAAHPSTLEKIWLAVYVLALAVFLVSLATKAAARLRSRRRRHHDAGEE